MPQRQTAPIPSHVPVGQPLYIFDVGTHKFDGTLYRSRARAHTHIIPLFDSMDTSSWWYLHSLLVDRPLYIYDISRTLFHTHCICYIFWLTPTPKKTRTNPHTISLYVCISLTQPHVGGVRIQEENRCTVHVLMLHAQPQPRGYTVELISPQKLNLFLKHQVARDSKTYFPISDLSGRWILVCTIMLHPPKVTKVLT